MLTNQVENCCAAKLIFNFGHTKTNGMYNYFKVYKPTKEEVYDFLIKNTKLNQIYVLYINEDQYKAIGKSVTKAGFKRTGKIYHAYHKNWVYQYTKSVSNK